MWVVHVVSVVFCAVGAGLILWGVRARREAAASRAWPVVEGRVTAATVVDRSDVETGDLFRPHVTYRYSVGSQTYAGDRIHFGRAYVRTRAEAVAVVDRYPVGRRVEVRVNPARPKVAVLEPVARGLGLWSVLGTTIIGAVAVVNVVLFLA